MADEALTLDQVQARIDGAVTKLVRVGFGVLGVARMLEAIADSAPKPSDPDGRLLWPEVVRLLSAGRHAPSVILSHLRALADSPTPSQLRELAPVVKEELDRLIRAGQTLDQIVAHLRAMGAPVSRSAVHRYRQRTEAQLKRYREAQEVAGVWVAKLGEDPKGNVGRLLQEMLKTVAFQTLASLAGGDDDDEGNTTTAQDLSFLARAVKDLGTAERQSLELELRLRKEIAAEVAARAETAMKAQGLTANTVDAIKKQILGVAA